MAKYEVHLVASTGHTVEVEAESADEAVDAALSGDLPSSCHQCPQIDGWEFLPDVDERAKRDDYITKLEGEN